MARQFVYTVMARIPETTRDQLFEVVNKTGLSISELIREALDVYLSQSPSVSPGAKAMSAGAREAKMQQLNLESFRRMIATFEETYDPDLLKQILEAANHYSYLVVPDKVKRLVPQLLGKTP